MSSQAETRSLAVVVLADDDPSHADTLKDHVHAFRRHSRHHVRVVNPIGRTSPEWLDLDDADVVVLHWSIVPHLDSYLAPPLREAVRDFDGLKIQFIQDEYRWVDAVTATIRELGVAVLYSVVPESEVGRLYGDRLPDTEVLPTLTGFVPGRLRSVRTRRTSDRPLDIAYRGRELPYWLGRIAFEKVDVGRRVLAASQTHGLRVDIAWREQDRIYGKRWIAFLSSAKSTLGTPSGASIVDYDGTVASAVTAYLRDHPEAAFAEVQRAVLEPYEGSILIDVISPRAFEAAALRTALVLYEGRYSGILEPEKHYQPLERDLSNFEDVVRLLRDRRRLEELTERAHHDLIASQRWSLAAFVQEFDEVVSTRGSSRRKQTPGRAARRLGQQAIASASAATRPARRRAKSAVALTYASARFARSAPGARTLRRRARETPVSGDALTRDLLRLGLLHERRWAQPPFVVESVSVGEEAVVIRTATDGDDHGAAAARDVADAFACGRATAVVWDNVQVGPTIVRQIAPGARVGINVGAGDRDDLHRFEALSSLAAFAPDDVGEAVAAALRAGQKA